MDRGTRVKTPDGMGRVIFSQLTDTEVLVKLDAKAEPVKMATHLVEIVAEERSEAGARFEERKEMRAERRAKRAEKLMAEAEGSRKVFDRIHDAIPFGQPILVGHHSERRHRRDLKRASSHFDRWMQLSQRARELGARSESDAIRSDDPDALAKLQVELDIAKVERELEKNANAQVRKLGRRAELAQPGKKLGIPEWLRIIDALEDVPDPMKQKLRSYATFATWRSPQFGNHTAARIKYLEERIATLNHRAKVEARTEERSLKGTVDGMEFTAEENRAVQRVQIVFTGKPSEVVRGRLKRLGFKWAPSQGAWQRLLTPAAWASAESFARDASAAV